MNLKIVLIPVVMTGIFVLTFSQNSVSQTMDSSEFKSCKENLDSLTQCFKDSDTTLYVIVYGTEFKLVPPEKLYQYISTKDFRVVNSGNVVYYIIDIFMREDPVYIRPCPRLD